MEMSGFSETQLQVREAVSKICEKYPDVRLIFLLLDRSGWASQDRKGMMGY
jgi:hypothetical protein